MITMTIKMIKMTIQMLQGYDDHENDNEDKEYVGIDYDGKLCYGYDLIALVAVSLTTTTSPTKT